MREKKPNDFVTEVDLASEQAIVPHLLAQYPDHGVRTEESAQTHGHPDARHVWIVDPLDGTTNFIHGYPNYAVSIALAIDGRVDHGVVLDVCSGDVFHASRGQGAWCNGGADPGQRRAGPGRRRAGHQLPGAGGAGSARAIAMLSRRDGAGRGDPAQRFGRAGHGPGRGRPVRRRVRPGTSMPGMSRPAAC